MNEFKFTSAGLVGERERLSAVVHWNPGATDPYVVERYVQHEWIIARLDSAPLHQIAAADLARELEDDWNHARYDEGRDPDQPRYVGVGWDWLLDLINTDGLGLSLEVKAAVA